ncbi:MAG: redoxin domain-containing protein [Planctomycetota bacterium]|nr:redoxin domain-containing protein [Planctomycetota bacterium]
MRFVFVLLAVLLTVLVAWPGAQAGPETDRVARVRDASAAGVGRLIEVTTVTDVDGTKHDVRALAEKGGVVFVMTSTTCPLSRKYAPAIGRLATLWQPLGYRFVLVDVQGGDTAEAFRDFAEAYELKGLLVHDPKRVLASALGASTTTEAFVLDKGRTLVYRGAVDDQYGIGTAKDAPTRRFLHDALEALHQGKAPAVRATSSPGCALEVAATPKRETTATWHGSVSRIVQRHCVECHREGGIAPFALETPAQVEAQAGMIQWVVEEGVMPPWFAAAPADGEATPWANDRRMPNAEKRTLLEWLGSKRPVGDPKDAPVAPTWPATWSIGTPDAIIPLPRDVKVKAEGTMPYVNLRVKTDFPEDRWVRAWEVIPSARDVVHHVLVFVESRGANLLAGRRTSREEQGFFAAFVPGNGSAVYPDGFAKRLPKGATLYFQLHYTPNGKATVDRTRLGLRFASEVPEREVRTIGIANVRIRIPAGAPAHEERATLPVLFDAGVMAFMPHMHYRGKAFRYELVDGEDQRTTLLDVPRYDFNWQLAYRLKEPLEIPAGSRIDVRAVYDNSKGNPANPDPTKPVRWGLQSEDEMLIGYIEYYLKDVAPGQDVGGVGGKLGRRLFADGLLRRLDKDKDGRISKAECPRWLRQGFRETDTNQDGYVDRAELMKVER